MGRYAFARSWGREGERLAALERQLDPVSQAAIGQLRLAPGWRCWEVGAGGGSMAAWLADWVTGSGSVLATDIDISVWVPEIVSSTPELGIPARGWSRGTAARGKLRLRHGQL